MAYTIGAITGAIFGVVCLSLFLNFLAKKLTQKDAPSQRLLSTVIATLLAMMISTVTGLSVGEHPDEIVGINLFRMLAGIGTAFFYALKLKGKLLILAVLYGIAIWFVVGLGIGVISMFVGEGSTLSQNTIGLIVFLLSCAASGFLIANKKLPVHGQMADHSISKGFVMPHTIRGVA